MGNFKKAGAQHGFQQYCIYFYISSPGNTGVLPCPCEASQSGAASGKPGILRLGGAGLHFSDAVQYPV